MQIRATRKAYLAFGRLPICWATTLKHCTPGRVAVGSFRSGWSLPRRVLISRSRHLAVEKQGEQKRNERQANGYAKDHPCPTPRPGLRCRWIFWTRIECKEASKH